MKHCSKSKSVDLRLICTLGAALCLTSGQVSAEELPEKPQPGDRALVVAGSPALPLEAGYQQEGAPREVFDRLWEARQVALQRGDLSEEKSVLAEMTRARTSSGWPNLFTYAIVLGRQAVDAAATNPGIAQLRAQAAVSLAPQHPLPHAAYARVGWATGLPASLVVQEYSEALWLCVSEPIHARRIGGEILVAAWFSFLAAAVLFAFVTMFRHAGGLAQDLERLLPRGATIHQRWLLVCALALTPLLLGLGTVVSVVVWLTITGFHMVRAERLASVTVLLWLTLLPLTLPIVLSHLSYPGSPSEHLYLAGRDQTAPQRALDPNSLASADPAHAKLVQGSRAYWSGDLTRSHSLLEDAGRYEQAGATVYTALGSSRFRQGKRTGAIEAYSEAERLDSKHVIAIYNASRVYYSLADHENAVATHQRASALDFDQVQAFEAGAQGADSWYVPDETIPNSILYAKSWQSRAPTEIADAFWQTFFIYSRRGSALTALAGIVLALLIAIIQHGLERSEPTPGQKGYHSRFSGRAALNPFEDRSVQIRRQITIHRRQARLLRLQRAMGLLVAGGAHMVKGASLTGLILAFLFGTSLILFLTSVGFVPALVPLEVNVSRILAIPYGISVFVWYVIAIAVKPQEDW